MGHSMLGSPWVHVDWGVGGVSAQSVRKVLWGRMTLGQADHRL
jgi:hypothetical protein